jgi:hypothetical protein
MAVSRASGSGGMFRHSRQRVGPVLFREKHQGLEGHAGRKYRRTSRAVHLCVRCRLILRAQRFKYVDVSPGLPRWREATAFGAGY